MPSANDPSRSTAPLPEQKTLGSAGKTSPAEQLFTAPDHDQGSAPPVSGLPGKVRSFEDERDIVGALPKSSLAQPATDRPKALHEQAEASAQGSSTAQRQNAVAEARGVDQNWHATGRNPMAETQFGDAPRGDGPVLANGEVAETVTVGDRPVTPSPAAVDDSRQARYGTGPQPHLDGALPTPEDDEEDS